MKIKEIFGIIILIMTIPLFIQMITYTLNMNSNTPEKNMQLASELMVNSVTPWWLDTVITLSGWGIFGALVIIALFWILSKNPELA